MLFDLLSIFLTLSLFLIYHVYFWTHILDREDDVKQHLIIGINTRHHTQAENNASILLAVHTLRIILVGIFMSESSFTLLLQTLGSVISLELEGTSVIRSVILGSFFSLSFLCWTTVIRCAGNYSYTNAPLQFLTLTTTMI